MRSRRRIPALQATAWKRAIKPGSGRSSLEAGDQAGKVAVSLFQTELLNSEFVKSGIEMLVDYSEDVGFNRFTILNLHALLSQNLLPDASACGRLRRISVGIGGTVFHPLDVPQRSLRPVPKGASIV